MTKWFPALDEVINDIVNVWEGDSIENLLPQNEFTEDTAQKIEEEIGISGELPSWLDPNIELSDVHDEVVKVVDQVKSAILDWGWGKQEERFGTLLLLGVAAGLVVLTVD